MGGRVGVAHDLYVAQKVFKITTLCRLFFTTLCHHISGQFKGDWYFLVLTTLNGVKTSETVSPERGIAF